MTVNIIEKRIGIGIIDRIFKANNLGILSAHIDDNVSRNARIVVGPPFEHVSIVERANTNWCILIIDLGVQVGNLELANIVGHCTHSAVAQQNCGIAIDKRNG